MSKQKLIIFDLDDTLLDTSDIYWQARSRFVELLNFKEISAEEIVDEFEKVDSIHMKTMGFSPYRYEKTMLFTYNLILKRLNREPSDEIISQIKLCGRIIIEQMPKVIDGANELLEWAAKYFKLALLTRGEENLQLKKLYSTGLVNYFDLIKVVSQKNTGIFRQFLEDTEYSPEDTWVIGDSIKSDINPGIEVGVSCILYVYNHHSYYWKQEYKCQSIGSFYKTHHLLEAKQILQSPLSFKQVNTLL